MAGVVKPASEADLAEIIAGAAAPFEVIGTGTKRGYGRPVAAETILDLSGFSSLAVYEPEELILEAGPGARLTEIEALVESRGQQLAFEPPDLSGLFGAAHSGSLGGVLAANLSGPRRIKAGAARDHVLGIRGANGEGQLVKAGARVVKNVTGYDLPKLMAGSFGTLMALTAITFKVLPRPETEETLVLEGLDDRSAVRAMSLALQSSCEVSGAAHMPGTGTLLRLEGIAASVAYRREALKSLIGGNLAVLDADASRRQWTAVRDVRPLAGLTQHCIWRLSVPPSEGPETIARIGQAIPATYFYDWGGGLIWLAVPASADGGAAAVRGAIASGHATLISAPAAIRAAADVFQPQAPALAALSARVKDAFDPQRRLNPGRMYKAV